MKINIENISTIDDIKVGDTFTDGTGRIYMMYDCGVVDLRTGKSLDAETFEKIPLTALEVVGTAKPLV